MNELTKVAEQYRELIEKLKRESRRHEEIEKAVQKLIENSKVFEKVAEEIKSMKRSEWFPHAEIPVVRRPARKEDCPAAPICESLGNLRRACCADNGVITGPGLDVCIVSVILLVARLGGMWSKDMIEVAERKREVGFVLDKKE